MRIISQRYETARQFFKKFLWQFTTILKSLYVNFKYLEILVDKTFYSNFRLTKTAHSYNIIYYTKEQNPKTAFDRTWSPQSTPDRFLRTGRLDEGCVLINEVFNDSCTFTGDSVGFTESPHSPRRGRTSSRYLHTPRQSVGRGGIVVFTYQNTHVHTVTIS